jgi:hypothetical protein
MQNNSWPLKPYASEMYGLRKDDRQTGSIPIGRKTLALYRSGFDSVLTFLLN